MKNTKDKKLTRLIIGCHKDKKLLEIPPASKYDLFIQAGSALTDERIFPYNDHDGFTASISDRNSRYSEMTAVYWAHHNLKSDYIGIEHYRRRFLITDDELDKLMADDIGLITLKALPLGISLFDFMNQDDFVAAFDTALKLVKKYHPEDYDFALKTVKQSFFRPCNMNIWKGSLFHSYCEWLFPMLDEFYRIVPEKRDSYLHRDAGFMAERLSHVYVEMLIANGISYHECEYRQYKSEGNAPETDPVDYKDRSGFKALLEALYSSNKISQCRDTFFDAYNKCDENDAKFYGGYARVFELYMAELKTCDRSLFEYLPEEMSETLTSVSKAVSALNTHIIAMLSDPCPKTEQDFGNFIKRTGFSDTAINRFIDKLPSSEQIAEYISAVLNEYST